MNKKYASLYYISLDDVTNKKDAIIHLGNQYKSFSTTLNNLEILNNSLCVI